MPAWTDLAGRDDEEIIDDLLIAAALPEREADRDVLFEILRDRHAAVPGRAFRLLGGPAAIEEDFLGWFWCVERLKRSLEAYRRTQRRAGFAGYLFVKAKWLFRDYFRDRKRRPRVVALAVEVAARGRGFGAGAGGDADAGDDGPDAASLDAVRACIERLGVTERVPLKLVHLAAVGLSEADLAAICARSGRPRAEVEAMLAPLRAAGRRLTLAEVGALMNMKLHTAGTYVARARGKVCACAKRKAAAGEGRP